MMQKIIYTLNLITKFKKNIRILYILFVIDIESHLNLSVRNKKNKDLISFKYKHLFSH